MGAVTRARGDSQSRDTCAQQSSFTEQHFTIAELAAMWNLSQDVIRRLFEKEPGVMIIETTKRYKRRYRTLRIPESVVQRVHRKMLCP